MAVRPPSRSRHGRLGASIGSVVLILVVVGSSMPARAAPENSSLLSSLTVGKATVGAISSGFWGANLRPYYSLGSSQMGLYNRTVVTTLLWPGGSTGDEYNLTANRVYSDAGNFSTPSQNISDFVTFCRSVRCHAILQLPGEIDQPATAAYYVNYVVKTLHFSPTYWEIGDEPARWTHFGFGWANWTAAQSVNATPGSYAKVVHDYIASIRAVVPTAAFVGLPGVGTGGYHETIWIKATVAMNGANLSAVAIHVYPAGGSTTATTPTASEFLGTLNGKGGLAARVPGDLSAIQSACPTCHGIRLIVSELGSGNQGGPYSGFMGGYVDAIYTANEMATAVALGVSNVDVFAWQSTYNGSLLGPTGLTSRNYLLFSQVLPGLGPAILSTTLTGAPAGAVAIAGFSPVGLAHTLLVVNANATSTMQFSLAGSGFPVLGPGGASAWGPTTGGPTTLSWVIAPPLLWTLPPASLVLITMG